MNASPNITPATKLIPLDIEQGYEDERWLGWGYLGGRRDLPTHERDAADEAVLAYANAHGWDYERLFAWLNSRPGRHYADDPTHPKAHTCLEVNLEHFPA